jgi:hypothetical protein
VRLRSEAFKQRSRQTGLSDTGFAQEQHDLTFAALGSCPASQQEFEFFFTPDKLSYTACVQGFKAALH